jgi:hypothetical protein
LLFFIASKQALQYTGLSFEGWKITFATPPQFAQVVSKYSRGAFPAFFFASRQALQLLGLFVKPFSW